MPPKPAGKPAASAAKPTGAAAKPVAKPVAKAASSPSKPATKTSVTKPTAAGASAKPGAKAGTAKIGATKAGAGKASAGKKTGAKAPQLSEEEQAKRDAEIERELEEQRKLREAEEEERKEKERKLREEYTKLIREEEERLQKREDEKRKREKEYNKRKQQIFELAFDDELDDVRKILGIADDKGNVQRACTSLGGGGEKFLCPCLGDPWFRGPDSMLSYVEVDCLDANDSSALSEASVGGAVQVMEELLRHGAFSVIDHRDSHGRTPVFRAAFMGKPAAVAMLLRYGADASIRNKENESPADVASDPAVKESLAAFDAEGLPAIRDRRDAEMQAAWTPPPPPPDPAELVPKTEHSARIGLRALADTLDDIRKAAKRQTVLVDLSSNAQTFLRYRDNNMLLAYKPGDLETPKVRMALLGALRFGKPLVLDNGDLELDWTRVVGVFDGVLAGLWDMLWGCSINQDSNWMKLVQPSDGENFKEQAFTRHCLDAFQFIIVTKHPQVPSEFAHHFFLVTTA